MRSSRDHQDEGNFNPVSQWEEYEKIRGLTLYDINRAPQQPGADQPAQVVMTLKSLNSELTCPICLSILRSTMIVMECLHRFCSECIQKCLRVGRKECPACRKHVPSRRSLRRDLNFDAIIAKIYPDLDAFEHKEGRYIAKINKARNVHNAFTESCQQGIKTQLESRRKWRWGKPRKGAAPARGRSGSGAGSPAPPPRRRAAAAAEEDDASKRSSKRRKLPPQDETEWFVLTRHPREAALAQLPRPMLGALPRLQIRHLKLFLAKRLTGVTSRRLQITFAQNDKHGKPTQKVLDDRATLSDISDVLAVKTKKKKPLVLHYSLITVSSS